MSDAQPAELDGFVLADKPAGQDLARPDDARAARRWACGAGRPRRHARPVRDRAADRARRPRAARAALRDGAAQGVPRVARFGAVSTTGDPEGEITQTGRAARRSRSRCRTGRVRQRPPAYSAVQVDGRRAYERARARGGRRVPEREVDGPRASSSSGARATAPGCAIACSSGTYVRTLIADLGDAYCEELRRTRIGPFHVEDADPRRVDPRSGDALGGSCQRVGARRRRTGRPRQATGQARRAAGARRRARRAERPAARRRRPDRPRRAPRGRVLKPVVGFRGVKVIPPARRRAAAAARRRRARSTASTSATAR